MKISLKVFMAFMAMWCSLSISASQAMSRQGSTDDECKVAVTAEVTDKWYGDNCYIHQLTYSITCTPDSAISYGVLEQSFDKGATWTTITSDLYFNMEAKLPIMLSLDKETVRYRITAVPKTSYEGKWSDSELTYETSDYDITTNARLNYSAGKVIMNVGSGSGTDISLSHLGNTKDGYQIWACQGIDARSSAKWEIDDNSAMSLSRSDFFCNTFYDLTTSYYILAERYVPGGTSQYHFVKVKGAKSAEYFVWSGSENFHPFTWYLYPRFGFKTTTDITLDKSEQTLKQGIEYSFKDIDGKTLDSLVVKVSNDQGKTWITISKLTSDLKDGTKEFSKAETVNVPGVGNTVRYKIVAYPKSCYKVLAEEGCWTYETEDYPITLPNLNFSITAQTPSLSTYAEDATTGKRTIDADVAWSVLDNMADLLDGVNMECSTDDGTTWTKIDESTSATGSKTVKLPAGYAKYLLRVEPCLKGKLADIDILHQYALSDTLKLVYNNPQVTLSATEESRIEDEAYSFRTFKLHYACNDVLEKIRSNASIYYSYDDGKNWLVLPNFTADKEGDQNVIVDASEKQCKFRIKVRSYVQGAEGYCTAETENIIFE